MSGDFTSGKIANDDTLRMAFDDDKVEHLGARMHGDTSAVDFLFESLVAANKELAGQSGLGRKMSASPELRRTNGCRGVRRIRGRREHPEQRIGR
jgi:hypothetical protein